MMFTVKMPVNMGIRGGSTMAWGPNHLSPTVLNKTNSNIGTHNDTTTKSDLNFLKMAVSCHLKIEYALDRWTHFPQCIGVMPLCDREMRTPASSRTSRKVLKALDFARN